MYHPIPLLPQQIIVPGEDTPEGRRYSNTFANDHRQNLPWSDKHELQILHLLASAHCEGEYNVPSEPLSVFRIDRDDGTLCDFDRGIPVTTSRFDLITDDGRQRRRDGIVLNERLRKIAEEFKPNILDGTLYDALVKAPYTWMSPTFAEELATGPWFDAKGQPRLLKFRVDIVATNPDLCSHKLLLDNVRRKEASIPTPLPALAKQYTSLLAATDSQHKPVFTSVAKLAEAIGKTAVHVRSVLDYERIEPKLREAVDKGTCGLGLLVSGADCVAFGPDHTLLPPEHQLAVFDDLVKAFAVEIDDGIPDNKTTRRMVAALKAKLGHETVKRAGAGRSERIAERAAARLGIEAGKAAAEKAAEKAVVGQVETSKPVVEATKLEAVAAKTEPAHHVPAEASPSRLAKLRQIDHPTIKAIIGYLDGKFEIETVRRVLGLAAAPQTPPQPQAKSVPSSPFAQRESAAATILTVLLGIEKQVGDLRSMAVDEFRDAVLDCLGHNDNAQNLFESIMKAYTLPKTRRHVDIGVHVREMLSE